MKLEDEIRGTLMKTIGFRKSAACTEEIRHLVTEINEEEKVIAGVTHGEGYHPVRLYVFTDQHVYILRKQNEKILVETLPLAEITEITMEDTETYTGFYFFHEEEKHFAAITEEKRIKKLIKALDGLVYIHFIAAPPVKKETILKKEKPHIQKEKLLKPGKPPKSPKIRATVSLKILNGAEELGYGRKRIEMIQRYPGEVRFQTGFKDAPETFLLHEYERTENIVIDRTNVSGAAFWGKFYGGDTGAIGSALKHQMGRDKSTATLFLENKEDGRTVVIIIECKDRKMQALSKFIKHQTAPMTVKETLKVEKKIPMQEKYALLEQIQSLKEKGVLTEEEFAEEKAKILES